MSTSSTTLRMLPSDPSHRSSNLALLLTQQLHSQSWYTKISNTSSVIAHITRQPRSLRDCTSMAFHFHTA